MTDATNKNPYDTLFRAAFEDPQTAKELTLLLLPAAEAKRLAGAEVTVDPRELTAPRSVRGRTDLLLQFTWSQDRTQQTAYVYVLYEHKSTAEKWVSLQLLRYVATLWYRLSAKTETHTGGRLPEILPLVLYHGEQPWNAPLQFSQLVNVDQDATYVPHFEPEFINLTHMPDHQITGSLRAMLGLLALKHARLRIERASAELLTELLHRAEQFSETRPLVEMVEWIYVGVKSASEMGELVAAARRKGYHGVEVSYMTWAEELLQEGMQEGLQRGLEKGSLQHGQEVLTRLVERKFGLTETERAMIMVCEDPDALDAAIDEFAVADSKQQVLSKLT